MDDALHMLYKFLKHTSTAFSGGPSMATAGMEVTKQSTLRSWTATAVPGVPCPPNRSMVDSNGCFGGSKNGRPYDSDRFMG